MTIEVQCATVADAGSILELWRVARSPVATTEDDVAAIERLLAHETHSLLVAHLDARAVGTAIAAWDGWRGHIYRVAVLPQCRLQGIGRQLVSAGHRRLRTLGATRVDVSVGKHEPGPIAFWEAVGYHLDPEMNRFAKVL